ncbi:hypothetical protein B0H12DRAFT_1152830 [Mycena haematopus]|nr:hypothetical protein B0H12DRAFT_1152830 [Mycena haematopus]
MDGEPQMDTEFAVPSTTNTCLTTSSAIFSGSDHFTVAGGTFISNRYSTVSTAPTDFRRIPFGDIDLQREIQLDHDSGVLSLRTLHSALIDRGKLNVTVALYQGPDAEEEWQQDIVKYTAVRHPNVVQLYGIASCHNIHAMVFHDDLIPFRQFLDFYRHSLFSSVYIHAFTDIEFRAASRYFSTKYQHNLLEEDCTFFIRRSTGQLCVDLVQGGDILYTCPSHEMSTQRGLHFLAGKDTEATIIDSLTLYQYHSICYWELAETRFMSISTWAPVNLGSVAYCPSRDFYDDMVEIASVEPARISNKFVEVTTDDGSHWNAERSIVGEIMANGWTRVHSDNAVDINMRLAFSSQYYRFWLSQANHIFTSLQVSSHFPDYVFLNQVHFTLTISATETATPTLGFLFLCPPRDFQTGQSSFKWPDCPAYWALDPSGAERLTSEDAANLGFPSLRLSTEIEGNSWDATVYTGLRQFHEAKGFNPDSQGVAQHLGHRLYRLSNQTGIPVAHVYEEDEASDNTPQTNTIELENTLESTLTDYDVEEEPVSSAFKFMMTVQLSLILFCASFWVM